MLGWFSAMSAPNRETDNYNYTLIHSHHFTTENKYLQMLTYWPIL